MNSKILVCVVLVSTIVISSSSMANLVSTKQSLVFGQNDTASNSTESAATQQQNETLDAKTNQSSEDNVETLTNLTRQNLDPILDNLFSAREGLLQNNLASTFDALSAAASQLFKLKEGLAGGEGDSADKLNPLQRQVEFARSVMLNDKNTTVVLRHINAADTKFIELAQDLPSADDK
jgi:hypothetical protein